MPDAPVRAGASSCPRPAIVCGPDPGRHVEAVRAYAEAGFDHVYVHQVGPDQAGFIDFYAREVLPAFRD